MSDAQAAGTGPPRASVVVATKDRAERLHRLLAALARQTIPPGDFEVVVVDDGSSDDTQEIVTRAAEDGPLRIVTLRHSTALGAGPAREAGWRRAAGDVIAFTDDDCEPAPAWLEAGLDAIERHPEGFVQGATLPNPSERDRTGPFTRTIEIRELSPNFNTCNMFYPRALLERLGGFDTETFGTDAAGEDSDLAWRAIGLGATPTFEPAALAHHAVNELGPLGKLRVAARSMDGYALHPELRREAFVRGVFWKREHLYLTAAALGASLPRALWPLRVGLAMPYAHSVWSRWRVLGGGPGVAAFWLLHDLVEVTAVVRSGIRHRTLML